MSLTRENENNANLYRAISEKEFKKYIKLSDVMGVIDGLKHIGRGKRFHVSRSIVYRDGYNKAKSDLKKQLESKGE